MPIYGTKMPEASARTANRKNDLFRKQLVFLFSQIHIQEKPDLKLMIRRYDLHISLMLFHNISHIFESDAMSFFLFLGTQIPTTE